MHSHSHNTNPEPVDGGGIVVTETNPALPSRAESETVARRRYQHPKPEKRGNHWTLRYRRDEITGGKRIRRLVRETLAPSSVPYREAVKLAAEKLRPLNQGLVTLASATGFRDYVEQVYLETELPLMAKSHQNRYRGILKNYLLPAFGDALLRDMTALCLQHYLTGLGRLNLSHESNDKIRDCLSSVMGSAKRYGMILTNPVEGLRLPASKRGRSQKPHISPAQFNALVQLIAEPYATMVYVAVFTGLRVSELAALKWKNVHADSITVELRYCRGDWGAPKSEASNTTIPVSQRVLDRIHKLSYSQAEGPDGPDPGWPGRVPDLQGGQGRRSRGTGVPVGEERRADAGQQHSDPSYQAGWPHDGNTLGELALPENLTRNLAERGRRPCARRTGAYASFESQHHS